MAWSCAAIAAAGILLMQAFTASADQPPARPDERPPIIHFDVNLIVVHATVMNRSGAIVSGLNKQDFQLFVDGAPKTISLFEPEDAPVAAGIVVDNSASMVKKGPEVIAASLAFARASNPQDEMFVVHFSDQVRLGLPPDKPFTGNIPELEEALSRFSAEGATALYDAVAMAVRQCKKSKLERKVLLLVSDGGDNASKQSLDEVMRLAQTAGITVYCIGIYDEADRDKNPRVLTQIAELTGGKSYFPTEAPEIAATCVKIARDIRQQYTLGFKGKEDGGYHAIKVIAKRPDLGPLEVKTRSGYFAPSR